MSEDIKSTFERLAELILLAAEKQSLKKAVFSKPRDTSILKMVMTLRSIGGQNMLQAEYFHKDNKATHKNIPLSDATPTLLSLSEEFMQINVICTVGESEFKISKSGKSVLLGGDKLLAALSADAIKTVEVSKNNVAKKHILDGSEPF